MEGNTKILYLAHLETNGTNYYTVLSAIKRSGLNELSVVKCAVNKSVKTALTKQGSFSRKNYVAHAFHDNTKFSTIFA
jgi:hypothetical protein